MKAFSVAVLWVGFLASIFAHAQTGSLGLSVLEEKVYPVYSGDAVNDLNSNLQSRIASQSLGDLSVRLARKAQYTIVLEQHFLVFGESAYPTKTYRKFLVSSGAQYQAANDCIVTVFQKASVATDGRVLSSLQSTIEFPDCAKSVKAPVKQKSHESAQKPLVQKTETNSLYSIRGVVRDIVTKLPIGGAEIVVEGSAQFSARSNSSGEYVIANLPAQGILTLRVDAQNDHYRSKTIRVRLPKAKAGQEVSEQDFNLVPAEYSKDKIVFVLTWSSANQDIDAQLCAGRTLTYFLNKEVSAAGTSLDKDDRYVENGRETTLIELKNGKTQLPAEYSFYVSQCGNDPTLSKDPVIKGWKPTRATTFLAMKAHVDVYQDGELIAEIDPPAETGVSRHWEVAKLVRGKLVVVNKLIAGRNWLDLIGKLASKK